METISYLVFLLKSNKIGNDACDHSFSAQNHTILQDHCILIRSHVEGLLGQSDVVVMLHPTAGVGDVIYYRIWRLCWEVSINNHSTEGTITVPSQL